MAQDETLVSLYVYDLSHGMARQYSPMLLGPGNVINAIYHTSIVLNNSEYVYGQGIQTWSPAGSTHHGQPMEVIPLGATSLPIEIIHEYLDGSLRATYTAQNYDLFKHNCNNFSNDFATFLVGHGIPQYILDQPDEVLRTPLGQMLAPQLDQSMRSVTQAPGGNSAPSANSISQQQRNGTAVAPSARAAASAPTSAANGTSSAFSYNPKPGVVHTPSSLPQVESLLEAASTSAAVIFFTSSTCAPCKILYGPYDSLAAENPRMMFIKVDTNAAFDVASRYQIRATPTITSFFHGKQEETWSGADASRLRGTVQMLAARAFPPHKHQGVACPKFLRWSTALVRYEKCPPLDKLKIKLGDKASPVIDSAIDFIKKRSDASSLQKDVALPNLDTISTSLVEAATSLPLENQFAAVDLLRLACADQRVSDWFAANGDRLSKITNVINHVEGLGNKAPYNLRLVSIHLSCNMFMSRIFRERLASLQDQSKSNGVANGSHGPSFEPLVQTMISILSECLLDLEHPPLRVAAASLAFNMATVVHIARGSGNAGQEEVAKEQGAFTGELQSQLAAALIESLSTMAAGSVKDPSADAIRGMIVALGRLAYLGGDDILELCGVMDASDAVKRCKSLLTKLDPNDKNQGLADEVSRLLKA